MEIPLKTCNLPPWQVLGLLRMSHFLLGLRKGRGQCAERQTEAEISGSLEICKVSLDSQRFGRASLRQA
jgi:hypothetical protein